MHFNGAVFTHPSYQMVTGWVPVCVFLLQKKIEHFFCLWFVFVWVCVHLSEGCVFWDFGLCQSFCCWSHVWAYTCTCVYVCVLLTTLWFIPSFSAVAVWGPQYVMPVHRGLYVIETGLWKPPAIWRPAASDVCTSIHQFLLIAQSWDSVPWLSIGFILHRLNTLICNNVWDLSNPGPSDWPDNAELDWEQVARHATSGSMTVVLILFFFYILLTFPAVKISQSSTLTTEMVLKF